MIIIINKMLFFNVFYAFYFVFYAFDLYFFVFLSMVKEKNALYLQKTLIKVPLSHKLRGKKHIEIGKRKANSNPCSKVNKKI